MFPRLDGQLTRWQEPCDLPEKAGRMTRNGLIAGFAFAALLAGCGRSGVHQKQHEYEVVQEGSATGVTSTIQGPGETLPPITGTNADTTTAFTINPNTASAPPPLPPLVPAYPGAPIPPPMTSATPIPPPRPRPTQAPPPPAPTQTEPAREPAAPPPADTVEPTPPPPPTDTTTTPPAEKPPTQTDTVAPPPPPPV